MVGSCEKTKYLNFVTLEKNNCSENKVHIMNIIMKQKNKEICCTH